MGSESLANSRTAIDVTGHNIANAHTPGYSRQRALLETKPPSAEGPHSLGTGARLEAIQRVHDDFVENQLRKEGQIHAFADASKEGLSRLEGFFNLELEGTIRNRISQFFNAMREFANTPEESAVRFHAVESGVALAQSFGDTLGDVRALQRELSQELEHLAGKANQKISQIASLNQAIQELEAGSPSPANDLQDKRDQLVRDLGELMDTSVYRDTQGHLTIRGPGGHLLVEGNHGAQLVTGPGADSTGEPHVFVRRADGHTTWDVTTSFSKGRMGGLLAVRDTHAARVRAHLNDVAYEMATKFNQVHAKGFGAGTYGDTNGREFFDVGQPGLEPADALQVNDLLRLDPRALSGGATPNAPGDNIIANELVRLQSSLSFRGGTASITSFFDETLGSLGVESMRAKETAEASGVIMSQLESLREEVSGVSLDEEAANLLKYQHLFTASSKLITTADELFKTILDLKR